MFTWLQIGAVGKTLLRELLLADTYKSVTTIGRREVKLDDSIPQSKLVCPSNRSGN